MGAVDAQLIFWYAVFLLYWYKSTNSDAAGEQMCPKFECTLGDGTLPLGPHFACCYLYMRTFVLAVTGTCILLTLLAVTGTCVHVPDTQEALAYRRRNSAAAALCWLLLVQTYAY